MKRIDSKHKQTHMSNMVKEAWCKVQKIRNRHEKMHRMVAELEKKIRSNNLILNRGGKEEFIS